ncbi:MAG TPA: preprotein translocase subunit SecE [Candidatus Saccharimonadales bacterium]|nr:preprotein translocase subunit SecE [Candidatus Saccharimonadales bacterium]
MFNYIAESRVELSKVTWPKRAQAIRLSLIVVAFSIAVALVIGGLDWLFTQALQKLILKV